MANKYDGKRIIRTIERFAELTDDEKWLVEEQIEECCAPQPEAHECTDYIHGKVSAWPGVQLPPQCTPGDPDCLKFDPDAIYAAHKARLGDRLTGYKLVPKARSIPCGEKIEKWDDKYGCCVCPPDPLWRTGDGTNIKWVDWYGTYDFRIEDGAGATGTPPYTWDTIGNGLSIAGSNLTARLTVGDCFCNPGLVIAKDACGVEILYFIYLNGGTLETYSDTYFDSDYGWPQDGLTDQPPIVQFYVYGQNEDLTIQSVQSYSRGWAAIGPEEDPGQFACAAGIAEEYYDSSIPLAIPQGDGIDGLNGFQQCDGVNVWWKDYTGICEHPDGFPIRYYFTYDGPGQKRGTVEWSFDGCTYDELLNDTDLSAETMGINDSAFVYYIDGNPPFEITVSGPDTWLDADHTTIEAITSEQRIKVFTGPDACGPVRIDITDACGQQIDWTIRVTIGAWSAQSPDSCECKVTGPYDTIDDPSYTNYTYYYRTEGKYKQVSDWFWASDASGCDFCGTEPGRQECTVNECPGACPTDCQITGCNSRGMPGCCGNDPCIESGPHPKCAVRVVSQGTRWICSYLSGQTWWEWLCP